MLGFYHQFQDSNVAPYHKHELVFPGVSIEKVEMDRLITYFDQFYSDISNGVFDTEEELKDDTFKVSSFCIKTFPVDLPRIEGLGCSKTPESQTLHLQDPRELQPGYQGHGESVHWPQIRRIRPIYEYQRKQVRQPPPAFDHFSFLTKLAEIADGISCQLMLSNGI